MAIIDKPSDYFNTKLYTGNGSTQSITGVGFQPDWVWLKARSSAYSHQLFDVARGATKLLSSEETSAEQTLSGVTSFDSDGFAVGSDAGSNNNTTTFASWNWKAGGSASNNTDGDITSSVSVNQEAGFSIIKYDSNNTAGQTVGHGLGVTPNFLIFKKIDGATNWHCWNDALATTNYINLNLTDAQSSSSDWLGVSSSLITLKTNWGVTNDGGNFICYAFAEKKSFSKIGSYIGSGSDVFINTGFKVGWLLVKVVDGINGWLVIDTKRSPANPQGKYVYANASSAEGTVTYGEFFSNR